MRCIFCKSLSDSSISVEHVIPESLGNVDHILPRGWVCDSCNNYLARKVEAPFLNSEYGRQARFNMAIPNKRGRTPIGSGLHPMSRSKVELMFTREGLCIGPAPGEDDAKFVNALRSNQSGTLWIPHARDPALTYDVARFIGMVALEGFALRGSKIEGWNADIVERVEFDELRDYVRRGKPGFIWPINIRRLYPADKSFSNEEHQDFQMLHEFDVLAIESGKAGEEGFCGEIYLVIAILGMEYVINLAGPELDGYLVWLKENDDKSYLYSR